jgi:hypothetical protein
MQASLLNRAASGTPISTAEAAANDQRYAGAHALMLLTLILSCIFLLMWMYRAHKNLRSITSDRLEFTPGGAVGWWFCPFLNLVRPYQVMKEIFTVSRDGTASKSAPIVGAWWALWILSNIIARVGTGFGAGSGDHPTIPDLVNQTWANMIDIPFFIVAGVLLMWIIRSVDVAQESRRNIAPEVATV